MSLSVTAFTALLALLAVSPSPTPAPSVACTDQAAALLPKLEPLIGEFKDERDAAFATWTRDAIAKWKETK